jgi:hypothetical protein
VLLLPVDRPPENPKQDIQLTVSVHVALDTTSSVYEYRYTVENDISSGNALDIFGVAPLEDPNQIQSPVHWAGFDRFDKRLDCVAWGVVDSGGYTTGDTTKVPDVELSPFNPRPGSVTTGFLVKAVGAPIEIAFYAEGFDTLLNADLVDESKPMGLFNEGVTGATLGPAATRPPAGERHALDRLPAVSDTATGSMIVPFHLPLSAHVELILSEAGSRRQRILVDGERPEGLHAVSWNGRLANGEFAKSGAWQVHLRVNGVAIGQAKIAVVRR